MTSVLSPERAHALFDILTHAETYAEIEKFKYGGALERFGPPFSARGVPSASPILQSLMSKFALTLPGLCYVSDAFWEQRARPLVDKLGHADLSESYDKGGVGVRRTLGTAFATLFEYPTRGVFGGWPKRPVMRTADDYDPSKPEDVVQGWHDWVQKLVHEDMVDEMFDRTAETGNLKEHSKLVQAAHEYAIINVAAVMHYTMVLSPDGQYLARIIANVNMLVPYFAIGQTLKVSNAATMINGMLRLVLAKLSVSGLTNFIGLTNNAKEGMNLLQRIISQVLSWDIADFKKRAKELEKKPNAPTKQHLDSIKTYVKDIDRTRQEAIRRTSITESKSIVAVILSSTDPSLPPLSEAQHALALEYLHIHLSIRDRKQLERVLCLHVPDLVTQTIKDVVAAFDPIIRGVHNSADMSASLNDFQNFMDDFVKLVKRPYQGKRSFKNMAGVGIPINGSDAEGSGSESRSVDIPSVEDYVNLVRKHIPSYHKFLHQVAKNGGEVTQWYRDYAKLGVSKFRQSTSAEQSHGAGALTEDLSYLFQTLSPENQGKVKKALDAHAKYLSALQEASDQRMRSILSNQKSTDLGPGLYLSRWQDLMNQTLITPRTPEGTIRTGADASVKGKTSIGSKNAALKGVQAPDVDIVVKLMGKGFGEIMKERAMD